MKVADAQNTSDLLEEGAWTIGQGLRVRDDARRFRDETRRLVDQTRHLILTHYPQQLPKLAGGADANTADPVCTDRVRTLLGWFCSRSSATPKLIVRDGQGRLCQACGKVINATMQEYDVDTTVAWLRLDADCYGMYVEELRRRPAFPKTITVGLSGEVKLRGLLRDVARHAGGNQTFFAGYSRGSVCQACGKFIKPDEIEYDVAAGTSPVRLDAACAWIFVEESRAVGQDSPDTATH